jgi:hypothetical protein
MSNNRLKWMRNHAQRTREHLSSLERDLVLASRALTMLEEEVNTLERQCSVAIGEDGLAHVIGGMTLEQARAEADRINALLQPPTPP